MGDWSFVSNHALALLCVVRDPDIRLRDIADCVGVTERTAHGIVSDLVEGGYLKKERVGNRNRYEVQPEVPMNHPLLENHWIGEVLAVLAADKSVLSNGRSNGANPANRARVSEDSPAA